ncbi:hypothetical protein M0812_02161 [Anaeramoeba flamelloides]|uniref:MADS-box domain-containing protein n=1 Tax=Anaeramoeba flamelloides TaxID=1746091 RepID=A0AAV7YYW8_9EUKA|nr:hypothetical protein M0812_02161 [Anaeramoeba flamelloides]
MGNYSIKTSQTKVLTEEKFQQHLLRIRKQKKAICVITKHGQFIAFNFPFQSLLHITQTNIYDLSIIEFIPKVQPKLEKTSVNILREEMDLLQNSKTGFQEFQFSFQTYQGGYYIPTRTILSIFCVSKKIYFQLVSKPKTIRKKKKRIRKQVRNANLNQKGLFNDDREPIQRSYTYTGVKKQQSSLENSNVIRRTQTTFETNYKSIIIHKNFTTTQRFRTPNLFNKKDLSNTKNKFNRNNSHNNNTQSNGLFNPNVFVNNNDFKILNNKKSKDNEQNNKQNKNRILFKNKLQNLKLTQQIKVLNKKSEVRIKKLDSKLDNIKILIRDLEDHLMEYQVTNIINDIRDLVKNTEKFYIYQLENLEYQK